jgi:hypothetical protein
MKYILLVLTLFPLLASAQQDTIKLPVPIAKAIVKDLISGDSAKAELELANQQIVLLNQKAILKDSIISGHVQKGILYEERIKNEQLKFNTQNSWVKDLERQNKNLKVKLKFVQLTRLAIIGGLTYLYLRR